MNRLFALSLLASALALAAPAPAQTLGDLTLWTFQSDDLRESGLGVQGSVAATGDLDGDGTPDLALGAPAENAGAGRVYLVSGATGREIGRIDSPQTIASEGFGGTLARMPDLTGDGVPELAVAAIGATVDGLASAGRVYTVDPAGRAVLGSVVSPNASDGGRFGFSLDAVPDVDGDGVADLVVGADGENSRDADGNLEFDVGRAYIVSGATGAVTNGLISANPSDADFRIRGSDLGDAVAGLGDIDGDGRGDIAVGAPGEWTRNFDDDPAPYDGRVYLWRPAAGQAQIVRSPNPENRGFFGESLAALPDLDGDGAPELLVGAPDETSGEDGDEGQAYVVSGATGAPLRRILPRETGGSSQGDDFGRLVARVPDVTGDGVDDFAIGDPTELGNTSRPPAAWIFDAVSGEAVWSFEFPSTLFDLYHIGGVPDLDGDGRGEIALGGEFGLSNETHLVVIVSGSLDRAEVEPNDTRASAQDLSSGPSPRIIQGIASGSDLGFNDGNIVVDIEGETFGDDIEDVFRVDLRSPGLRATLTNLEADVDLFVWDPDLNRMGASLSSGTSDETVDLPSLAPGTYYIGVTLYGRRGSVRNEWSPYTLRVEGDFGVPVSAGEAAAPGGLALSPPHPSPASDHTRIGVTLPQQATARLALYDALGRRVRVVVDGPLAAGTHLIDVSTADLAPGLYLMSLDARGARVARPLVVAR